MISLITVTYNSGLTLADTLQSVLRQSYPDIEYIIKDGGSTDNTLDIIKTYEPKFSGRLKWVSEKDKGIYDAMNKGIQMATGDVVGIVNSDDFLKSNDVIAKVAQVFENDKVDAIYGDVEFVNSQNLNKVVRHYSSKEFNISKFRYGYMPAHPSFFTYKKFFDEFGYYQTNYKIAADYELLIRFLYVHKLRTQYLPFTFVTMRTGGASTANLKSRWILNKEIIRGCKENGIWTCMPLLLLKYFKKIWELRR